MSQRGRRALGCIAVGASLALAGDGASAPPPVVDVPGVPLGVVAADVDGDARPDLVVRLDVGVTRLALLRSEGSGRFAAAVPLPDLAGTASTALRHLVAVDVDRDGDVDLVGAGRPSALWRNDGAGSFVAEALPPEADGDRLTVGDAPNGAAPDLLVTRDDAPSSPTLLVNDGAGQFSVSAADDARLARFAGWGPRDDRFAVADLDGDLRLDLAAPNDAAPPNVDLSKARIVSREVRDMAAIETEPGRLILRFVDSPNGSARSRIVVRFE